MTQPKNTTNHSLEAAPFIGQLFGRLAIEGNAGRTPRGQRLWRCTCSCGRSVVTSAWHVRQGLYKSCGKCQRKGTPLIHGKSYTPEYQAWKDMVRRCTVPTFKSYQHYGGRGITVCKRWHVAANFLADMGDKPSPNHTLERKNNNGNYEPENCCWATVEEQSKNRRDTCIVTFQGITMCHAEWAEHLGIPRPTMSKRFAMWSIEKAITTPLMKRYSHNRHTSRQP